ncbi:hypothetical protein Y032_0010g1061 [Ancylostoma ceylanicum]|uniref:MULE transposase domain-containing protein n=1 Tax=Ancylostoma ceylanicum TaxID=53326 RepID=A0A016VHM1_9BILA|nr:hypothetical protein Y032_0010g1061 [Ancylostoma ceylanicum]
MRDEVGALYIGSRKLWQSVFGHLHVRIVVCDGRSKQIPRDLRPTRTSQLCTIIAEVVGGHIVLLLFAFLPDRKEVTYRSLFRWFRENIEPYGGDAAIADEPM